MSETEVLIFLENLAAFINDDLGLDLSVPARQRIVRKVFDSVDYANAEATAHEMMHMLLGARTLH